MEIFYSWALIIMTVGFAAYWLISFTFIKFGAYVNAGENVIEFFRLWLKPLFALNFTWYILIEIIYSLIYWTKFLLFSVLSFFSPLAGFLNYFKPKEAVFFWWLFWSIVIYLVVMIPYFYLQFKLSNHFKKIIFSKLSKSLSLNKAEFKGQIGGIAIPELFFPQIAYRYDNILDWIKTSIADYSNLKDKEPHRFNFDFVTMDYMSYEYNKRHIEFCEAEIKFKGEEMYIDNEGKRKYSTKIDEELFDGVVICFKDFFDRNRNLTILECENSLKGVEKKKHREIHKEKFLIRIYKEIIFKSLATQIAPTYQSLNIEDCIQPKKIKLETQGNIQYLICEQKNLFLFLHTDLESTAFELNMNISVKQSMELFKQDLSLVIQTVNEIDAISKAINSFENDGQIN